MKYLKSILASSVIALSACTPFGPMGPQGGYEERQVGENAYVITFVGNGFTQKERTRDLALYRAAQIGEKLKYTHFAVMGEQDLSSSQTIYTGSTSTTNASVYGNYGTATTTTTPTMMPVYKPATSIGALYFEGPPTGRYLEVREVGETLQALRAKYHLK